MNRLSQALLTSAILAVGCGGNVVEGSGGTGGQGTGGAGGSTETSTTTQTTTTTETNTLPPACQVPSDKPGPYAVTFRFKTLANQTFYLRSDCYTNFDVKSCGDGYSQSIGLHGDCTVDCSDQDTCIDCGACPEAGVPVSPDASPEDSWNGEIYEFAQNAAGCSCHTTQPAPAGKYRITVPVFNSEDDATMNQNAFEIVKDFDLPAPGGVVEIDVSAQPN